MSATTGRYKQTAARTATIFDAVAVAGRLGHDVDWEPVAIPVPVDCVPGSAEKLAALARRLQLGQELFHPGDRHGLTEGDHRAAFSDWQDKLARVGQGYHGRAMCMNGAARVPIVWPALTERTCP